MKALNHLKSFDTFLYVLLVLFLVPLEVILMFLSGNVVSFAESGYIILAVLANIISFALFFFNKKKLSIFLLLLIGILIIPRQLHLNYQYLLLREESSNMINFVYEYRLKNNVYPDDIDDFNFKYESLKENVTYDKMDNGFQIYFHIGTKTTGHIYNNNHTNQYENFYYWYFYD